MADAPSESDSTTKKNPIPFFRVTLLQIFYGIALIAAGLSLFTGTIFFSVLSLVTWKLEFSVPAERRSGKWGFLVATVPLLLIAMFTQVPNVRAPARQSSCMNNMRQLSLGIFNYEFANGQFPRPFAQNTEYPHSWRVLILPFIEEQSLFDQYHFDEPWDSPSNQRLADAMPDLFRCLSNPMGNRTPYKLVTGAGTAFSSEPIRYSDILNSSSTIAIVEDVGAPVHWMAPDDLTIDEALVLLNEMTHATCAHREDRILSTSYRGLTYSKLDGSIHFRAFSSTYPISRSSFLITEAADVRMESDGESTTIAKPFAYFVLFIYGILMILPGFFIPRILTR